MILLNTSQLSGRGTNFIPEVDIRRMGASQRDNHPLALGCEARATLRNRPHAPTMPKVLDHYRTKATTTGTIEAEARQTDKFLNETLEKVGE